MTSTTAHLRSLELVGGDLDVTRRFYEAAFGWEWVDHGPGYGAVRVDGVEVGFNRTARALPRPEPEDQDADGTLVLLEVADLGVARAAVEAAGGEVVTDAFAYPGGRRFHCLDPSGNLLGVYRSDEG